MNLKHELDHDLCFKIVRHFKLTLNLSDFVRKRFWDFHHKNSEFEVHHKKIFVSHFYGFCLHCLDIVLCDRGHKKGLSSGLFLDLFLFRKIELKNGVRL